jgi:SAM-dependent methyltransferase
VEEGILPIVKIDLGGPDKPGRPGVLTLGPTNADVRASLDRGLPLRDNAVDEILTHRSLEHVSDFVGALEELWRVSKPGALIHLRLPHATSPWATSRDPRHQRQYTIETFEYFTPRHRRSDCPTHAVFEIERSRLLLTARNGPDRGRGLAQGTVARVLEAVANRNRGMQYRWERWLGHLIGFDEMYVALSAVKPRPPAQAPPPRKTRRRAGTRTAGRKP